MLLHAIHTHKRDDKIRIEYIYGYYLRITVICRRTMVVSEIRQSSSCVELTGLVTKHCYNIQAYINLCGTTNLNSLLHFCSIENNTFLCIEWFECNCCSMVKKTDMKIKLVYVVGINIVDNECFIFLDAVHF